ncbi:unnamed protein product [Caenorhabditis auriculariae]|uniref:Uncharacterized protein n=1 Tax=Caenorhabditis auriculariae TaxID=2777116 RepID=A0A8S1H6B8_9PELO|nr:unnamed protein product [Caenorhabditis auriculariae]
MDETARLTVALSRANCILSVCREELTACNRQLRQLRDEGDSSDPSFDRRHRQLQSKRDALRIETHQLITEVNRSRHKLEKHVAESHRERGSGSSLQGRQPQLAPVNNDNVTRAGAQPQVQPEMRSTLEEGKDIDPKPENVDMDIPEQGSGRSDAENNASTK